MEIMKLKVKEIIKAKIQDNANGDLYKHVIKDLYNDYNIYDNYLTFFDKVSQVRYHNRIDVYN
jgi:hypothetical protein